MEKQDCRVRLRLLFERRRVLTNQQRLEGLDRCWFILRSELSTVSDLACDIIRAFHLQSTCPDGLLLSMDGFVLPPFESTDLFRDNDLIRVRKNKGSNRIAIQLLENEDVKAQIENGEGTFEEQPHLTCSPILAIEQFEKESGGYLTDKEDGPVEKLEELNTPCNSPAKKALKKKKRKRKDSSPAGSKRKHNDSENPTSLCESRQVVTMEKDHRCSSEDNIRNLQGDYIPCNGCSLTKAAQDLEFNSIQKDEHISSKKRRKKNRQTSDQAMVVEDTETIAQVEVSHHNGVDLRNKLNGVCKSPDDDGMNLKSGGDGNDIPADITESVSTVKRQEYLLGKITESEPQANGEVTKVPSRSARRKKAKRKWLREAKLGTSKFEEFQIPSNHKSNARCTNTPDATVPSAGHYEDTIIPIVVRPGHIRFEHSDEDTVEENEGLQAKDAFYIKSTGAIEWSGPLDKKKGQKWGRMRTSSTWNNEKIPQDGQSKVNTEREIITRPEDFEKLCHITGFPKVGDVLAYRLVELSSTWCPEVSSFRVGQVTSYDPVTTQCILVPVPGYAIPLDKAAELELLPEQSLYNDDGSLEIEFTSLVDVRFLEGSESGVASTASFRNESIQTGPSNPVNSSGEEVNLNSAEAPPGQKEANGWESWEDIQRALDKKKAELQQQNGAGKQEKNDPPAKPSWSYRALRGSALGPTISLLRANNAL